MAKKIKVKTFIQALNTFGTNVTKAKTYLKDKRLTQTEKSIIQSFFYLRDNQFQEVVSLLQSLVTNDEIVESQRKLFLGCAYNNQGEFAQAIPLLESAYELMQGHDLVRHEFVALNNLFIVYRNLKNFPAMKETLKRMHATRVTDTASVICLLHSDFKFASVTGDYQAAQVSLEKLETITKTMSEVQIITFLVDKFDFYIKTDNLKQCQSVLVEMKNFRKFHLSANYNFMKILLNHYTDNKPIYMMDSDFKKVPILLYQIKLIQKLEEGDLDSAQAFWRKLALLYPQSYGLELADYKGDKCLFSICLDKHRHASNVYEIKNLELPKSKEKALVKLLTETVAPLHQEIIYEMIWREVPEDKEDLNKLARLVYVVKNKTGLNIQMKKSCYYLEKSAQKSKQSQIS